MRRRGEGHFILFHSETNENRMDLKMLDAMQNGDDASGFNKRFTSITRSHCTASKAYASKAAAEAATGKSSS